MISTIIILCAAALILFAVVLTVTCINLLVSRRYVWRS